MFALGFFVTVIQIVRIFTIANLKTYTNSNAIINWSIVEINLGVVVACVPTYGVLLRGLLRKLPEKYRPSFARSRLTPRSNTFYELQTPKRGTRMLHTQSLDGKTLSSSNRAHPTSDALSNPAHAYSASGGRLGESTEHIVPQQPTQGRNEIVVTTDIRVTNEERSGMQTSEGSLTDEGLAGERAWEMSFDREPGIAK